MYYYLCTSIFLLVFWKTSEDDVCVGQLFIVWISLSKEGRISEKVDDVECSSAMVQTLLENLKGKSFQH